MPPQPTFDFHHSTKFTDKTGKRFCFFDIYNPNATDDTTTHHAMITFFVINDEIDYQEVQRYRQMVESEFLIALQTGESISENLSLADNVIFCQANDVPKVLLAFDKMLADDGFIQLSAIDIKVFLQQSSYLYFSQAHAVSPTFAKAIDSVTQAIVQQTPNNTLIEAMMINQTVSPNYGLEEYRTITEFFDNQDGAETSDKLYAINMTAENEFWKHGETGIWLGVFFLFNH